MVFRSKWKLHEHCCCSQVLLGKRIASGPWPTLVTAHEVSNIHPEWFSGFPLVELPELRVTTLLWRTCRRVRHERVRGHGKDFAMLRSGLTFLSFWAWLRVGKVHFQSPPP